MNTPIILTAGVSIPLGGTAEPETSRLQNPFGTPMLIDEIRFDSNASSDDAITNHLQTVFAQFHPGRVPLSNGYVPITSYGKILDPRINNMAGSTSGISLTWRLPRPLYVAPTEFLIPRFYYDRTIPDLISGYFNNPATIYVTYVARTLPSDAKRPDNLPIPWVAYFRSGPQPITAGISEWFSRESDLVNSMNENLKLQRMIGRALFIDHATPKVRDIMSTLNSTVKITDSFGSIVVRDPTPFTHLFQMPGRAWTIDSLLPPKGFFLAEVRHDFPATLSNYSLVADISIVG